ncbi:MAG: hypothetical protein WCS20_16655 [Alphaproteobacteria bacterium]
MPISEILAPDAAYAAALDGFVADNVPARGMGGLLQSYAAVRQMPYFSGPDRTPLAALRSGRGACTAKHIILRDVLRRIGARAEVEIVEGDFASGIPLHSTQSPALQAMIQQGGITDFHCRVRLLQVEGDLLLDATWPTELACHGFKVNREWTGKGDTIQAISVVIVRSRVEDVLREKARLLAGLGAEMTARRQDFLRLLSGWLAELSPV